MPPRVHLAALLLLAGTLPAHAGMPDSAFLAGLAKSDSVRVCILRDDRIPGMSQTGLDPALVRAHRAHGCVALVGESRATLERLIADPRSWSGSRSEPGHDPVHTWIAFRFEVDSQPTEVRIRPAVGRLEAYRNGNLIAHGDCDNLAEFIVLARNAFPDDRELMRLGPRYHIRKHEPLFPCPAQQQIRMPDRDALDRLVSAARVRVARLVYADRFPADTLRDSATEARGYHALDWITPERQWQVEAAHLLSEETTWRGWHDPGWELSRPAASYFVMRFDDPERQIEMILFLDSQCIEAWDARGCIGRGSCNARPFLDLIRRAFPNDPEVQSLENLGPEGEE